MTDPSSKALQQAQEHDRALLRSQIAGRDGLREASPASRAEGENAAPGHVDHQRASTLAFIAR